VARRNFFTRPNGKVSTLRNLTERRFQENAAEELGPSARLRGRWPESATLFAFQWAALVSRIRNFSSCFVYRDTHDNPASQLWANSHSLQRLGIPAPWLSLAMATPPFAWFGFVFAVHLFSQCDSALPAASLDGLCAFNLLLRQRTVFAAATRPGPTKIRPRSFQDRFRWPKQFVGVADPRHQHVTPGRRARRPGRGGREMLVEEVPRCGPPLESVSV